MSDRMTRHEGLSAAIVAGLLALVLFLFGFADGAGGAAGAALALAGLDALAGGRRSASGFSAPIHRSRSRAGLRSN